MDTMKKGRWQATPKTSDASDCIAIRPRIKGLIVTIALWGLIPIALADFLIRRGGLRHD